MTTVQAETEYTTDELSVLQAHLDIYRNLPEVTSLTCFSIDHRGPAMEEACKSLREKGVIEAGSIEAEPVMKEQYFHSRAAGHEALREFFGNSGVTVDVFWSQLAHKFVFRWENELRLPGYRVRIADAGQDEMVRLFRAGLLKKND